LVGWLVYTLKKSNLQEKNRAKAEKMCFLHSPFQTAAGESDRNANREKNCSPYIFWNSCLFDRNEKRLTAFDEQRSMDSRQHYEIIIMPFCCCSQQPSAGLKEEKIRKKMN
jgi:hypothetical protein